MMPACDVQREIDMTPNLSQWGLTYVTLYASLAVGFFFLAILIKT